MGRVWWIGPFVDASDWESVATTLLDRCREQLDESIDEEEMAFDARAERLGRWAEASGLVPDPGSLVLTLRHELAPPSLAVRPIESADRTTVAPLHERLFPGTHTTGDVLVDSGDDTHLRIVAEVAGTIVGYVAVERQEDGSGYIDYLGVDETQRRRGFGAELVRAGVAALARIDARPVNLTVREDSAGARELYRSLGFDEERVARPYRRGFSIP
jgi:ribosomal protein S18 acetylase RimI-like enzyme